MFLTLDKLAPVDLTAKQFAQVVVAENGLPLRRFADAQGVWRYQVTLDQVSPFYLEALVNYEDRYFYRHFGINPLSLLRATWQWLSSGEVVSGGSTLTMQVARLAHPSKRDIWGKMQQMFRALQLEWHYSKQEILTYYINHAPFGGTVEGVEAASWFYFGYPSKQLTYSQATLLAVLPQAPSYYRPDRHPKRAELARNKVLDRLVSFEVLTESEVQQHKLEKVLVELERMPTLAPLLSQRLVSQIQQPVVPTYLDYDLQLSLSQLSASYVQNVAKRVSAAILVMENQTGAIKAHVGSADFSDDSRFSHVNMVSALRSPGSTLKPFIYAKALDEGLIHSHSLLLDVPLKFGDYFPENFNSGFSGPVTAKKALQKSLNVPAVQLMEQIGPSDFYTSLANGGLPLFLPEAAKPNLSMALGGVSTSLESLVSGFSALSNHGRAVAVNYSPAQKAVEPAMSLMSAQAAWLVHHMLSDAPPSPLLQELARFGYGVKTGTSYGHRDVWALAAAQKYTVGVWLGRPDNVPLAGHQGSVTAVPLLARVVHQLIDGAEQPVKQPVGLQQANICWPLGTQSKQQCLRQYEAWLINNNAPLTLMATKEQQGILDLNQVDLMIEPDTGLRISIGCDLMGEKLRLPLWPSMLTPWLALEESNERRIPPLHPKCNGVDNLQQLTRLNISGVADGQTFKPHKVSGIFPLVTLRPSNASASYYWFVNGKLQSSQSHPLTIELKPQHYEVALVDQLGKVAKVQFSAVN